LNRTPKEPSAPQDSCLTAPALRVGSPLHKTWLVKNVKKGAHRSAAPVRPSLSSQLVTWPRLAFAAVDAVAFVPLRRVIPACCISLPAALWGGTLGKVPVLVQLQGLAEAYRSTARHSTARYNVSQNVAAWRIEVCRHKVEVAQLQGPGPCAALGTC
jgi:hypothetical protein